MVKDYIEAGNFYSPVKKCRLYLGLVRYKQPDLMGNMFSLHVQSVNQENENRITFSKHSPTEDGIRKDIEEVCRIWELSFEDVCAKLVI